MSTLTTDVLTHRAAALVDEIDMATREGWSPRRIRELAEIRTTVLGELYDRAVADELADLYAGTEFAATETADLNTLLAVNATLEPTWLTGHRARLVLAELHIRAQHEDEQRHPA